MDSPGLWPNRTDRPHRQGTVSILHRAASDVEPEVQDIAFLDDVLFAL